LKFPSIPDFIKVMKQQAHVWYSGRVQGVGFRYTARETAQRLKNLTGWVKNLQDGRVELVIEGEEASVMDFLEQMQSGPLRRYIEDAQVTWSNAVGSYRDFEIR
jgi:acylphosphatase